MVGGGPCGGRNRPAGSIPSSIARLTTDVHVARPDEVVPRGRHRIRRCNAAGVSSTMTMTLHRSFDWLPCRIMSAMPAAAFRRFSGACIHGPKRCPPICSVEVLPPSRGQCPSIILS